MTNYAGLFSHYAGFVPVTIRPPQANNLPACLPTIKLTLEIGNVIGVLTTHTIARILKSKVYSRDQRNGLFSSVSCSLAFSFV